MHRVFDSSSFVPVLTLPCKLTTVLLLAFSLFKLVAALSQCTCSESNKKYGEVSECVTITFFFIAYTAFWWKSMIVIVLSALETVHDTVQYRYCIFSLLYRLLRIRLKCQNPLLSYIQRERERERERVHCKCTMSCTVHFIITLFNVGNVLLCVIYQFNFTVFMYDTRIPRYV